MNASLALWLLLHVPVAIDGAAVPRPPAWIEGELSLPRGAERPKALELLLRRADGGAVRVVGGEREALRVRCPVSGDRYWCGLYAALALGEVAAGGLPPVALGALWLEPLEVRRLPTIELTAGASIRGTVVGPGGAAPAAKARVELRPGSIEIDSSGDDRDPIGGRVAQTDEDGSFRFEGVGRGTYDLRVAVRGAPDSWRRGIAVAAGEALELPPLELTEFAELAVEIAPPVDPGGEPWTVQVAAPKWALEFFASLPTVRADRAGAARLTGLRPGSARVEIRSANGEAQLSRPVRLAPGRQATTFDLRGVEVSGVVRADGPLDRARLHLRLVGDDGEESVESIPVANDGSFSGQLSSAGEWEIQFARVGFHRRVPLGSHRIESGGEPLELVLGGGRIRGSVRREGEERLGSVRVHLQGPDGVRSHLANDEGEQVTFEFEGLPSGEYVLAASMQEGSPRSRRRRSAVVEIELDEDESRDRVELILEPEMQTTLHLRSDIGPIREAELTMDPLRGGRSVPGSARWISTDAFGAAELDLADEIDELDLEIRAPGHPLSLLRLRRRQIESAEIVLERQGGALELAGFGALPDSWEAIERFLVRGPGGGEATLDRLTAWAHLHADAASTGDDLVVPRLEPGRWTICVRPGSASQGSIPIRSAQERCSSALVVAGEVAAIELPAR